MIWLLLWILCIVSFGITTPGFSEFDATKYSMIAEQMLSTHHYLLAYWDGHFYSDKPPLLFWLIIMGWKWWGISTWWPQVLVLLIATASIVVTQHIIKCLWKTEDTTRRLLPFILIGCFYWVFFAKAVRVDSLLTLAVVSSLLCAIKALDRITHSTATRAIPYWIAYALSIGLGGFAKGPVILVFTVLPTLFLPVILKSSHPSHVSYRKWVGIWSLSTLVGLCIPLLWAIPAMLEGNTLFAQELAYRQITHRMHDQHESPFFYLIRLPFWLLPWSLYPPVWKGLRGEVLCLLVIVSGLLVFSLFGQKLPHYIYPLFPIFGVMLARAITLSPNFKHSHVYPYVGLLLFVASVCMTIPSVWSWLPEKVVARGYFLREIPLVLWGLSFAVMALCVAFIKTTTKEAQVILISMSSLVITLFFNDVVLSTYQKHCYFDHRKLPPSTWVYQSRYTMVNPDGRPVSTTLTTPPQFW